MCLMYWSKNPKDWTIISYLCLSTWGQWGRRTAFQQQEITCRFKVREIQQSAMNSWGMRCLVWLPSLHYTDTHTSEFPRNPGWHNIADVMQGLYIVIYGHNSYVTKKNHWKVWLSADYTKDYISFKINTLLSCSF